MRQANRPLHAREISIEIMSSKLAQLSGHTPWKTVTARISADIIKFGEKSRFKRTGSGLFALREWVDASDFNAKRRRLKGADEVIRVVEADSFNGFLQQNLGPIFDVDYQNLIEIGEDISRQSAEDSELYVQLIPTFFVTRPKEILTFTRTKRLPEARLHYALCANFGGHMRANDDAGLFRNTEYFQNFVIRELNEELSFSGSPHISYQGILYLRGNAFERQHAGLVFTVDLEVDTKIESLEPGMHIDVEFRSSDLVKAEKDKFDSWSQVLIDAYADRR